MAIQSEIYLAKGIALDRDYNNVLNYTPQQTLAYVQSKQTAHATNYSFIEDGIISVGFTYSVCLEANYMAFQNKNYSNRWMFAWIDEVRYVNNGTTEIKYTIDSWSSYFWNINSDGGCYVIREHTNDDTIGANTIDEGLAVPEVEQVNSASTSFLDNELYICVATNWDPSIKSDPDNSGNVSSKDGAGYNGVTMFNNNTFGSLLCLFDFSDTGLTNLENFLFLTNTQGHIDDVHDMFIVPKCVFAAQTDLLTKNLVCEQLAFSPFPPHFNTTTISYKQVSYMGADRDNIYFRNVEFTPLYNYGDYSVKNNKCYCYPYNYLMVSNNVGKQNILKLEEFDDVEGFTAGNKILTIQMSLSVGMSGRIVPVRYRGRQFDYDNSIPLAKFPTCAWSADSYTNWLTEQSVNASNPLISVGADVASGGSLLAGVVTSAAVEIARFYGEYKKAQLLPEITGGQSTGDVNFGNKNNNFSIVQFRIKLEHLKQIDDYFSRYGYKTLRVKKPNISGRAYWNYLQIGSNENLGVGDVPEKFMNDINRAARKGVTIWHNHANIGNFTLNNSIVS